MRAVLSLGANLGDPRGQLAAAVRALASDPAIRVVAVSDAYETAPIGKLDQPPFVNIVALVDADLATLGALPGRYHVYARDIRLEFDHLDADTFAGGRAQVLRRLLALDPLYRTPTGDQLWAQQAKANMEAELASLSG